MNPDIVKMIRYEHDEVPFADQRRSDRKRTVRLPGRGQKGPCQDQAGIKDTDLTDKPPFMGFSTLVTAPLRTS